jgi:hypothetical protein
LVSHNVKEAAGQVRSEVTVLREMAADEQVKLLLYENRVEDAFEAFKLREPKGPDYRNKEMRLHLDIGWIYLAQNLECAKAVDEFKNCIMGP